MRAFPVALAALALAAGASAQGIGDVAARERAKRKAASTSTEKRAFDNVDLEQGRPPGQPKAEDAASKPAGGAAPAAESSASPSPDDGQRARVQEAEEGLRAAEQEIVRLEARLQELQDKLNPMSITYVYGQARSGDATAEEQRIKDEIAGLPARIAEAKRAVVEAQRALADARRPPQG
jgi:chromosome segregation ATPase